MSIIYQRNTRKSEADLVIAPEGFSFWGFIIGPFIFIWYGLWKEATFFITLFITVNIISFQNIIIDSYIISFNYLINIYIAFDVFNRYEIKLINQGYFPVKH